ncbi:hypothetical protein SGODD07_01580 [Streptococcus gordonii]|uniref:DUF5082 domain-containing protein n=1 Tax=Streptococcus gordonii TaxID=1302 RepID=A0A139N3D3_STRGN|nr:hypothetical protein SGODD07_01580 [Streptococcus gordonii]
MANDKKARNDYNRAQGQKYQSIAEAHDAKRAANDEKIRRLKAAKKKLEAALQDYNTFKDDVEKIESEISESDFKGDIRDNFKKEVDEVVLDINSDINKHQGNLSSLSGKIASLEAENGNLIEWAKNAWDMAASFFQSLV